MINYCSHCGLPTPPGVFLCNACEADEWLDKQMEGESWDDFYDDSAWDEEREYQNPEEYWDEDFSDD